jgi:hypothetical protein
MVWRPAWMNGSAQRWASVRADPRAPDGASITGGSTKSRCRSPDGAPFRSTTSGVRPVSAVASSPGFAIVAEQVTITGFEP